MKKSFLFYLSFFIVLFSCSESPRDIEIQEVVIDLDNSIELFFSDIIDTSYFIPLDSKAIISEISSMEIGNDHIAILDGSASKSVYLFDWQGNLKTKINDLGEGPGKFRIPRYINLIERENKLVFYDDAVPKILTYNLQGDLLKETVVSDLGQFSDFKFDGENFSVFTRSGTFETGNAIMYVNKDIQNSIYPLKKLKLIGWEEDHGGQNSIYRRLNSNTFYFQINTTLDLLEFNKSGLVNHFRFAFSNRGLDYSNASTNPYDLLHLSRARDLVYLGPNHVDFGDYMFLDLVDSGMGKLAILDKRNNKAIKVSRIVNDLSLMMNFSGIPGPYNNQPGYLAFSIPYVQFANIRSQLDYQNNPYKQVVEKISSDDPESLILMIYKLKTNLEIDLK